MTASAETTSPTRALIDLAALQTNLRALQTLALPHQQVLAVVKADAYGHGAVPICRCLADAGVRHFGVARVEEGVELRRAGVAGLMLVFGGIFRGQEDLLLAHDLTPTLFDLEAAERLNAAARAAERVLDVHLKIDTGMSRLGFRPEVLDAVLDRLQQLDRLRIAGVYSHLALADTPDSAFTGQQVAQFRDSLAHLRARGLTPEHVHMSNSAAILAHPVPECTLVRPGIALYGSPPSAELEGQVALQPVMRLVTQVAQLQQVPAGTGISYGHRFVTDRPSRIAALPVGYADGFHRGLTGRVEVLIRGRRVPVVGTICMDWSLADVTDLPEVAVGDTVTLLGRDGADEIRAEEWAQRLGTIAYEIYCHIGQRVPRIYLEAAG